MLKEKNNGEKTEAPKKNIKKEATCETGMNQLN